MIEEALISGFTQGAGVGTPLALLVYVLMQKLDKIELAIKELSLAVIYGRKPPGSINSTA